MHVLRSLLGSRANDDGRRVGGQRYGPRGRWLLATLFLAWWALATAQTPGGVIQVIAGEGAMVFVDGSFVGTTTVSQGGLVILDVVPGSRAVRVVAGGEVVAETSVEVTAGGVTTVEASVAAATPRDAGPAVQQTSDDGGWSLQFGTPQHERVNAVAAGANGAIAVVGFTAGPLLGPHLGSNDVFVRVFDHAGAVVWESQFGTPDNDAAWGVAVDARGHVAVVGHTTGALAAPNAGGFDAFVRVHGPTGELLWEDQFGTEGDEMLFAAAYRPDGSLAVVGRTNGGLFGPNLGGHDAYVRVYRGEDGAVLWQDQFGSAAADAAWDVAALDDGMIVVVGSVSGRLVVPRYGGRDAFVRAYASDGTVAWQDQFGTVADDVAFAVATDGVERITVVGSTEGSLFGGERVGAREPFFRVYDARGTVLRQAQYFARSAGSASVFHAVAYDGAGNAVIGAGLNGQVSEAYITANTNLWTLVLDANSATAWQDFVPSPGSDSVHAVAVDASGRLVIAGQVTGDVFGAGAGNADAFVQVLPAPDGVELTPRR